MPVGEAQRRTPPPAFGAWYRARSHLSSQYRSRAPSHLSVLAVAELLNRLVDHQHGDMKEREQQLKAEASQREKQLKAEASQREQQAVQREWETKAEAVQREQAAKAETKAEAPQREKQARLDRAERERERNP